ncbi:hypothetical protein F5884DRAFT_857487 [Xylogone sp. PMI_703]|nr:hypothetical protein F5884DRAFT_857487 [Xylogone sp. PMI_703]
MSPPHVFLRGRHTNSIPDYPIPLFNEEFGGALCGRIASLFNSDGIENILWGCHLLSIYTAPMALTELSFVIPGAQLPDAVSALEAHHLPLCRSTSCSLNMPREDEGPNFDNPPAHFHFGDNRDRVDHEDGIVRLYVMEDKLPHLPVWGRGVNYTDGPNNNVISASDHSIPIGGGAQGIGRLPQTISGVRVPTLHCYFEAMVLLALRNSPSFASYSWITEPGFVVRLINKNNLTHPAFKEIYDWTIEGGMTYRTMIRRARESLGSRIHPYSYCNNFQKALGA